MILSMATTWHHLHLLKNYMYKQNKAANKKHKRTNRLTVTDADINADKFFNRH